MPTYVKMKTDFRSRKVCSKQTYKHQYACVQILSSLSLIICCFLILNCRQRTQISLALWIVQYPWQPHPDNCGILICRSNTERNFSRTRSTHPGENYFTEKLSLEGSGVLLLWTTVPFLLVISVPHELLYKCYVFSLLTLLINSYSFCYGCIQLSALYCDLFKDKTWWSLCWMEHNFHVLNGFITPIAYSVL